MIGVFRLRLGDRPFFWIYSWTTSAVYAGGQVCAIIRWCGIIDCLREWIELCPWRFSTRFVVVYYRKQPPWIPAFAGMTIQDRSRYTPRIPLTNVDSEVSVYFRRAKFAILILDKHSFSLGIKADRYLVFHGVVLHLYPVLPDRNPVWR